MKRFLLTAMILMAGAAPAAPSFLVVVNEANPISSLSQEELSDLFLKKSSRWGDGSLVVPVDQRVLAAAHLRRARYPSAREAR